MPNRIKVTVALTPTALRQRAAVAPGFQWLEGMLTTDIFGNPLRVCHIVDGSAGQSSDRTSLLCSRRSKGCRVS